MLIDEVMAHQEVFEKQGLDEPLHLGFATVFKVQNIANHIYEAVDSWDVNKDFPNIAPPLPYMWFEWHKAEAINSVGQRVPRKTVGILIQSLDLRSNPDYPTSQSGSDVRWLCRSVMFIDGPVPIWAGNIMWYVSDKGECRNFDPENICVNEGWAGKRSKDSILNLMSFWIHIPFLAMSFMHCKNVEVNQGDAWPDKLQRSRVKKGKLPLVRWHTIVIDPIKKIIAAENGGNPAITPRSLHFCRGHFKNFDEKGLFGKFRGMYWWPMHARGSLENGLVIKDYLVKTGHEKEEIKPA